MRILHLVVAVALSAALAGASQAGDSFSQAIEALGDYNYPRAVSALRDAAREGDPRAQEILGFMLLHGEALIAGLTPDRNEAIQWFGRAAASGSEVARHLLQNWARRGHADAQQALAAAGLRP